MASKVKIFNDPVYGFISVPNPSILLDLIDHPYFQRLRRIAQTALTHYVYPGAHHTRFHHALGAYHLMTQAVDVLRQKGVEITDEESEGVSIAILLHDIGHGPFSHTLEHTIIDVHHEELSLAFMEELNEEFDNRLKVALDIFQDEHPKRFLHQLVSGQLDMDRMDYLNRDSFFTGVSEGVIGYDRIIKMLNVSHGELVVEEKGIYSIEKFLIARRLMYWQVYLHKTVLSAERMLTKTLQRAKYLVNTEGVSLESFGQLNGFLQFSPLDERKKNIKELTRHFALLDDFDIIASLKNWTNCSDFILSYLSNSILNRRLFKLELKNTPHESNVVESIVRQVAAKVPEETDLSYLVFTGEESNLTYNKTKDEIKILFKNGEVKPISDSMDYELHSKIVTKHYLCFPKNF
ncbi:MAG: HD domain-containing protein [Saprospiraceae bacterium]|nr:HD domain-containing protein [Saprospiraceae bacterium]